MVFVWIQFLYKHNKAIFQHTSAEVAEAYRAIPQPMQAALKGGLVFLLGDIGSDVLLGRGLKDWSLWKGAVNYSVYR